MERRIALYQPDRETVERRLGRKLRVGEEVVIRFPHDFHLVAYFSTEDVIEAWMVTLFPTWTKAPGVEWIDEGMEDVGCDVFVAPGGKTLHVGRVLAQ